MNYTERQLEIINISIKIICSSGLSELTIKNIAREIGIKESSIYNHFKSKEDILSSIFTYCESKTYEFFNEINKLDCTCLEKINEYFIRVCKSIDENPTLMQLISLEFNQYGIFLKDKFLGLSLFTQTQIFEILNKAKQNNEIKNIDNEFALAVIWGCFQSILTQKLYRRDYNLVASRDKYLTLIEKLLTI